MKGKQKNKKKDKNESSVTVNQKLIQFLKFHLSKKDQKITRKESVLHPGQAPNRYASMKGELKWS